MLKCAVGLLLLIDASGSGGDPGFKYQMNGTAAAIRHAKFIDVIKSKPGGVAVSVMQFGWDPAVSIPWVILKTADDAYALANKIENAPKVAEGATGIGAGIYGGLEYFKKLPCKAQQKVMDISGDGLNNTEVSVGGARKEAIEQNVMINGLPIQNGPDDIIEHYTRDIMTPDGFVIPVKSWEDFGRAIRRKLVREVS